MIRLLVLFGLCCVTAASVVGQTNSPDPLSYFFDGKYGQVEVGGRFVGTEFHRKAIRVGLGNLIAMVASLDLVLIHIAFAQTHGVTAMPIELWESLLSLTGQKYRSAPMHGDLHGNNVRVRGTDAIVIDLASITTGPLVADVAALETWLAFKVPPTAIDNGADAIAKREAAWKKVVDELGWSQGR